ncbi:MAG: cation-translocating P-type ATPase [Halanaerobiales bacterium]
MGTKDNKTNNSWHSIKAQVIKKQFSTNFENGLSSKEAAKRLKSDGLNELTKKKGLTLWDRIAAQLSNFLIIILIAAAVISGILGETVDAIVIIVIVIVNAVMGIVQESKAEKAMEALQEMSAPEVNVIRDGETQEIPSAELVKGDIIQLSAGDFVPADIRLIESSNLKVDESSLTGESVPAEKKAGEVLDPDTPLGDRSNSAFMGSIVNYGRGKGLVVDTGMDTELGKIAGMIESYEEKQTPLQQKLEGLGKGLGIATLFICAVVFVLGILRGQELLEVFMTAVSLAVAAIPEGLPAVVTIVLALGMQRMVKRHAIIRKLLAVETLGTTTVICSDKTGTLTQNEMTVVRVYTGGKDIKVTGSGYEPDGSFKIEGNTLEEDDLTSNKELDLLLKIGGLCNDSKLVENDEVTGDWDIIGDPTEGALVVAASKAGYTGKKLEEEHKRLAELPFDSERKRMTTIHDYKNGKTNYTAFVKGAPDIILGLSTKILENGEIKPLTKEKKEKILEVNSGLAGDALRVLAGAYRPIDEIPEEPDSEGVERDLVFVGLYGMIDPPRMEVQEAVQLCHKAGIKTKLITGDYADTALAIAKQLEVTGPEGTALTGAELEKMSDEELADKVEEVDVYARVSPEHKVRIVEALKSKGHVAAMTGDGVNDVLALKRADIGVAMGITGTDVAKETAEMVLTDDNFASIVSAVEEGRIIYSNIRKFVYFLLSCNVGEIFVIFFAMLIGWPIPLVPVQILWVNLVTDAFPALALGMEEGEPHIMDFPPRDPDEPILNRVMKYGILSQGIFISLATLLSFYIGYTVFGGAQLFGAEVDTAALGIARTMAFATLITAELLRAYTSRSERYSLATIGMFKNKYMIAATTSSFVLLLIVLYVPFLHDIFSVSAITLQHWLYILGFGVLPLIAAEVSKVFIRKKNPLDY